MDASSPSGAGERRRRFSFRPASFLPPGRRQVAVLTRQLAVMVGAGLPLAESLRVLVSQQENATLRRTLREVAADVEAGSALARAMSRHPSVFSRLFVAMTTIGEAGGTLDRSLERLAMELEKGARLASQLRSAFAYPLVVGAVGVIVVALILWRVVPTFQELYEGLDAELPLATRIVVAASESFGTWASAGLFGLVGLVVLVRWLRRMERPRVLLDRALLAVPLFGRLSLRAAVSRFCRTLATLVGAGVPVLEGLDIAGRTLNNRWLESSVAGVRTRVESGAALSAPLRASGLFPPMVVQMVRVGERTGELDGALERVAEYYEDEVRRATEAIIPLMEPLLILMLGAVIGGIVVSMYLPIWTLVGRLS